MPPGLWPLEKAKAWYQEQPWLVGCNFIPSTAINQLEMWQWQTFDVDTIDLELSWAANLGFNSVRVYLHDLVYEIDAAGLKTRMRSFLNVVNSYGIRPIFVLFDDCWNQNPKLGMQPDPIPGVHNSGWVQSPGTSKVDDSSTWGGLQDYVEDLLSTFGQDERILMWDLYNEPGNNGLGTRSLPFLQAVSRWAQSVRPEQPLTVGLWADLSELNQFQLSISDVITFHNYEDAASLEKQIDILQTPGRPVICTEYMARTRNSRFETHLPIFKRRGVGCFNWGLVSGRTNTIFPWGSPKGAPEPEVWFHDIFRKDGTPFDPGEVEFIRTITG
jgi:hypothetical protein